MKSPFGDLHVFDSHVHFFSERFFLTLARQSSELSRESEPMAAIAARTSFDLPSSDPKLFAEDWRKEIERYHLSGALLIASVPGDEESVAAATRANPDLFRGAFMVDPTWDDAVERTVRAFDEFRLQVVCFFPAMHAYDVGSSATVRAICEAAAQRPGTAIFVHCGVLSVGIRGKLGLPSLFDLRRSNPLAVHALASAFPNLPFIIPHFGAGMFREALMVADHCPNVYLDTSSSNGWTKYLDAPQTLEGVFERSLAVLGPDRLIFGSDSSYFPRGWNASIFETQSTVLARLGVGENAARAIFGGTLRRLLHVDAHVTV